MDWFLFIIIISAGGQDIGNSGEPVLRTATQGMCHHVGNLLVDSLVADATQRRIVRAYDFSCVQRPGV